MIPKIKHFLKRHHEKVKMLMTLSLRGDDVSGKQTPYDGKDEMKIFISSTT